jgi:hypothetical protein
LKASARAARLGSEGRRNRIGMAVIRRHWARKFDRPISLKRGERLITLTDARSLILSLPARSQGELYWQFALALLVEAAQDEERSLDDVNAQLSRALKAEGLV